MSKGKHFQRVDERALSAALAYRLDRVAPRRDLWHSVQAEILRQGDRRQSARSLLAWFPSLPVPALPPKLLPQLTRRWPLSVPVVAVLVAALVVAYVAYIGPEVGEPTDVASEAAAPATEAQRPLGEVGKEPEVALQAAGGQQAPAEAAQEDGGPQVVTDTETPGVAAAAVTLYPVPQGFAISVSYGHVGGDAFVVTADGLERLTSSPSNDVGITWSPDCSRIAFNSNRVTPSDDRFAGGNQHVWVMDADGANVTRLTDSPHRDGGARWSPDGTRIAFRRLEVGEGRPSLKSTDIFVINADGSGETRLTDGPGLKENTSWSPDGKRMLLTFYQPDPESGFPDEETSEIYVMNSDGTDMKNLSNRSGLDGFAEWSPDGKLIAFQSTRGNGTDNIFVMDADGGNIRRLTDDPASDMQPHWSPDGKWISFTSQNRQVILDERRLEIRIGILRGQAEQAGVSISEEQLRSMAEEAERLGTAGRGGGIPANVFIMKADGSEVQAVIDGWGGEWSTCMAQR